MNFSEEIFGYNGKIVVITGGAGLIAGYIAEGFLRAGAAVSLWDLEEKALKEARDAITGRLDLKDMKLDIQAVDCGSHSALAAAFQKTEDFSGIPDVLVNGVGGNRGKSSFVEQDIELFQKVLYMNLVAGMILPTQVFAGRWIEAGHKGSIINFTSMTAYSPWSGVWAYGAAKAGVMNLTRGAALEFARHGIRVNSVSPGVFVGKQNHDLLIEQDEPLVLTERGEKIISRTPMGRFGDYKEIQGAILFLASNEAANFITGIDIPVDGGFLVDNI